MELISSVTVGAAGSSSITFSSIPATYTDLVVLYSCRGDGPTSQAVINLNSSGFYFTNRVLYNTNGNSTGSYAGTTDLSRVNTSLQTASVFGSGRIYISNYASSANKYLQFDIVTEDNTTGVWMAIGSTTWADTAAITSLTLSMSNFVENSTAYLYGILKGSGGATVS